MSIYVTDRSFKLEQFHFDVTGIMLQSSDHTLQGTAQIQYSKKHAKMTDFCRLAIQTFEWFEAFERHWIQTDCQQLCMKAVDVRFKGGYINGPSVGGSHRCSVAASW
jgi:hypothetical protein